MMMQNLHWQEYSPSWSTLQSPWPWQLFRHPSREQCLQIIIRQYLVLYICVLFISFFPHPPKKRYYLMTVIFFFYFSGHRDTYHHWQPFCFLRHHCVEWNLGRLAVLLKLCQNSNCVNIGNNRFYQFPLTFMFIMNASIIHKHIMYNQ